MQDLSPSGLTSELEFFKAKEGDRRAEEAVIQRWMPLIHKMTNKYGFMAAKHQRDDLLQMGRIAVMEAIRSYSTDSKAKPSTWIWWKVRGKVQGFARQMQKHPKYMASIDPQDSEDRSSKVERALADPNVYEVKDEYPKEFLTKVLEAGCRDGAESTRAKIVCARFGLLGQEPRRPIEVAREFGLSRQSVNGHLAGFYKRVRKQMPELESFVSC